MILHNVPNFSLSGSSHVDIHVRAQCWISGTTEMHDGVIMKLCNVLLKPILINNSYSIGRGLVWQQEI